LCQHATRYKHIERGSWARSAKHTQTASHHWTALTLPIRWPWTECSRAVILCNRTMHGASEYSKDFFFLWICAEIALLLGITSMSRLPTMSCERHGHRYRKHRTLPVSDLPDPPWKRYKILVFKNIISFTKKR